MPGSRQLIEAFGEWQSCEDPPSGDTIVSRGSAPAIQEFNRAMLGRTIEAEVIPRLMMAHRGFSYSEAPPSSLHITSEDISELARIVVEHDTSVASSYIDALRNQGVPIDSIFVELMAPTARLLGEMWKSDQCCFTDVTVGMARLQQIVHELSPEFEREAAQAFDGRRILLLTMPGEQHTLGLMIVEEYFRRYGWDCCSSAPKDVRDMTRLIRGQHFDVVGISVGWGALLESIASAIQAMRRASKNKSVVVLVGGNIFLENPAFVSRVGADGTAEDGRQAILQLRSLLNVNVKTL
jgi:methanogenic corrinoid protein MtbC1